MAYMASLVDVRFHRQAHKTCTVPHMLDIQMLNFVVLALHRNCHVSYQFSNCLDYLHRNNDVPYYLDL